MNKLLLSALTLVALVSCNYRILAEDLIINPAGQGTQFGTKPTQGMGFWGAAVTTQPSGSAEAAVSTTTSVQQFVVTGHNGAGSVTLTGAPIGAKVISVINLTTPASVSGDFEATLSVAGQIQQTTADLHTATLLVTIDSGGTALLNEIRRVLVLEGLMKGSN